MNLYDILNIQYPNTDFTKAVILQDDGKGAYIKEWNINTPKPTEEQIAEWFSDTTLEIQKNMEDAVKSLDLLIDNKAKARGYDSTLSICTYLTSTNEQWAAEAKAFIEWRDAVWTRALKAKDDILSKSRTAPTQEEFIQELPELVWP